MSGALLGPRAVAVAVNVSDDTLSVDLSDGRMSAVPTAWYPRLSHGRPEERSNWRLIGSGEGIHWPDLDEDLSVDSLLVGRASAEGQASLGLWIASRRTRNL